MNHLANFAELIAQLRRKGICKRVGVVNPNDDSTIKAVHRATKEGFIKPVIVDNRQNPQAAAEQVVEMVQAGEIDMIMKGLIHSDTLLRAILKHHGGLLEEGSLLTQIGCAHLPHYHKLLFYSDAAVIPFPTQQQRIRQVHYVVTLCHALGIEEPRLSLIHCVERVNEHLFPFTAGYREIIELADKGEFGACIVDGPLDLKTSCSYDSMMTKGIRSRIAGEADALIFPEIESANTFHKSITLFGRAHVASILQGSSVPVVLPSRADDAETKYYSLALAISLLK